MMMDPMRFVLIVAFAFIVGVAVPVAIVTLTAARVCRSVGHEDGRFTYNEGIVCTERILITPPTRIP